MSEPASAPSPDAVLEVRGLQKHFGGLYALSGLDMEVRQGLFIVLVLQLIRLGLCFGVLRFGGLDDLAYRGRVALRAGESRPSS